MREARYQGTALAAAVAVLCLVFGIGSLAVAASNSLVPAVNVTEGVGLKGYDPIAYYVNGQPTKGAEHYRFVWKGVAYVFASEENVRRFKADP